MIEIEDLHKSLSGRKVLDGLCLSVAEGETLVILGRSGTGKSVTLRHLVGLMRPDRGSVRVFGREVADLTDRELRDHRREIGYLFQDGALLNWLDLAENVALPLLEAAEMPRREIEARAVEVLSLVELDEHRRKFPSQISGGMRKRAGLARALVSRPRIVLYDEPTSGLDPISSSQINRLINDLRQRLGITQVVVTHDMGSAFDIADRIALLHEGRIRAIGPAEEVRRSPDPAVQQFIRGEIDGPLSSEGRHRVEAPPAEPAPGGAAAPGSTAAREPATAEANGREET